MLRREALAAANSIFHFFQHFDGETVVWWQAARREFRTLAGLVMGLYADAGARIAPYVFTTDAQTQMIHRRTAAGSSLPHPYPSPFLLVSSQCHQV